MKKSFRVDCVEVDPGNIRFQAYEITQGWFSVKERFIGSFATQGVAETFIKNRAEYPVILQSEYYDRHGRQILKDAW